MIRLSLLLVGLSLASGASAATYPALRHGYSIPEPRTDSIVPGMDTTNAFESMWPQYVPPYTSVRVRFWPYGNRETPQESRERDFAHWTGLVLGALILLLLVAVAVAASRGVEDSTEYDTDDDGVIG